MTKRPYVFLLTLSLVIWLSATIARANIGSVTAGNISGVYIAGSTVEGGGGTVVIDDDGIVIDDGTAPVNGINWTGGGQIRGMSGQLFLSGAAIALDAPVFTDSINMHTNQDITLNGSSSDLTFNNSNFQGSTQFLCVNSSGRVFASATACN